MAAERDHILTALKGVKDPRPIATMIFKPERDRRHHWLMALDAGAKPPIVWMGGNGGTLQRVTEVGGKFSSRRVDTKKYHHAGFVDLQVDRWRPDAEVYARCRRGQWMRYEESGGKISMLRTQGNGGTGLCILPAPDGNIYGAEVGPRRVTKHVKR